MIGTVSAMSTWSHATFVSTVHEYLARRRLLGNQGDPAA